MGRSRTSRYALEMDGCTSMCWWVNQHGKPTLANLTRYVAAYVASMQPGGVNQHISKALGYVPAPRWVRIVHNDVTRSVVVEWLVDSKQVS